MMNKRLIGMVSESKIYIAANVCLQWISLAANIVMMVSIAGVLDRLAEGGAAPGTGSVAGQFWLPQLTTAAILVGVAILVRFACTVGASRMGYLSSKTVKKALRERIYRKLLRLGAGYRERVQTSEVVQVAVEGVDQLETYFGAYLPQFFYAMLAPLTLFCVLCAVNVPAAVVLLVCVPLIPVTIVAVQRWAKKLLARYWGQYTALGDTFLENLQGLTTLKIYQADAMKQKQMMEESERFRVITMKVLSMQLNSITIMDVIAYGGAALGGIVAVSQYRAGAVSLGGALLILLLAADFFIPMRQLGSFFHIAMNGMAASDKIFCLLDLPEPERGCETMFGARESEAEVNGEPLIQLKNVSFSYEDDREILQDVSLTFAAGSFTALVGESGSGKSTISGILMGRNRGYRGSVTIDGRELTAVSEENLLQNVTYISHNSYLFKGTVRENLQMGRPGATEAEMWQVLERTKLADFLRCDAGLDTGLAENASNLSGGQCQRLALARALLHDSPIYVFDEATSNIDVESENDIMEQILELAKAKTVILISHRLANVVQADQIYVLEHGRVVEAGTQDELVRRGGVYARLWEAQQSLEQYGKDVA